MKKSMRFTLTFVASLTLYISGYSQKALVKADEAFDTRQYYDAITRYKDAYSSVPKEKRGYVLYKMGVSCRNINDYKGAEANLQKSIAANYDNPDVYFQ